MGDEYFANLDHIESVENFKEGYESEAHCSDSEGSGVDVSKMKIQPSALVSSNPSGRQTKKREHQSLKNNAVEVQEQKRPRSWCVFSNPNLILPAAAQSPSSSEDSNDDDDKDSKSEEESDSSDDTFVKDSYFSSSSVWRSYTTRGQVKGNKEGEDTASTLGKKLRTSSTVSVLGKLRHLQWMAFMFDSSFLSSVVFLCTLELNPVEDPSFVFCPLFVPLQEVKTVKMDWTAPPKELMRTSHQQCQKKRGKVKWLLGSTRGWRRWVQSWSKNIEMNPVILSYHFLQ